MKTKLILLFSLLLSANCLFAQVNRYSLNVEDFKELKVNDAVNVIYHCSTDSAGTIWFECTRDISSAFIFSNDKASLRVQVDFDALSDTPLPTLHVYSSSLNKVENSSDSTVIVDYAKVPTFKVKVIGNGTIFVRKVEAVTLDASISTGNGHIAVAEGLVSKGKYSNVGTGVIEAGGVTASEVKVTSFGTGNIDVCAVESITIYGAGSGTVYYIGNPRKISNRSIGVKTANAEQ